MTTDETPLLLADPPGSLLQRLSREAHDAFQLKGAPSPGHWHRVYKEFTRLLVEYGIYVEGLS